MAEENKILTIPERVASLANETTIKEIKNYLFKNVKAGELALNGLAPAMTGMNRLYVLRGIPFMDAVLGADNMKLFYSLLTGLMVSLTGITERTAEMSEMQGNSEFQDMSVISRITGATKEIEITLRNDIGDGFIEQICSAYLQGAGGTGNGGAQTLLGAKSGDNPMEATPYNMTFDMIYATLDNNRTKVTRAYYFSNVHILNDGTNRHDKNEQERNVVKPVLRFSVVTETDNPHITSKAQALLNEEKLVLNQTSYTTQAFANI